jgi:hypothetical protein
LKEHAYKRIVRGRCYAIASRSDLDWNGIKSEQDSETKRQALEQIWLSLKLYDWHQAPEGELSEIEDKRKSLNFKCEFSTIPTDTQTAIEKFTQKYPGKKVRQ